jgi:hypothetical protein
MRPSELSLVENKDFLESCEVLEGQIKKLSKLLLTMHKEI